jgi:hypothetical protein
MFFLGIYILGIIIFNVWDAFIGFGFEFPDISEGPNAILCSVLWPISLPIIMLIVFGNAMSKIKEHRIERKEEKIRFRIAAEREREQILEQIEKEMSHVKAEDQNTTEHARLSPGSSSSYVGRGE